MDIDFNNPFRAEDFKEISWGADGTDGKREAMIANKRFKEIIEAAPVVKCVQSTSRQPRWECWESPDPAEHVTHKARLVAIERLEEI